MRLEGLHHITAITGDAARNVDFYTRVLGLRLVAKTVNQDDPSVYHLFYADEQGRPGTELTFFEYPRAIPGRAGAGMVHRIVSRVASEEALAFWARRLGAEGVAHERVGDALRFADPEGLGHELAVRAGGDSPLVAEHPEIPAELALQGFDGVVAYSAQPEYSGILLERLLGATALGNDTWELRGEVRGATIAYDEPPPDPGRQSA
ncbi:MAG: VOC family protein, partial [Solirubrobacteraceae bacterium]